MTKPEAESVAARAAAEGSEENVADDNWRSRLGELWRLYRRSAPDTNGKFVASCATTVVATLLPLALVFVAALLADRAAGTSGGGFVGWAAEYSGDELAVFLGLVALVTAAAVFFEMTLFAELGALAGGELRKRVFGRLISLPLGFFVGSCMDEVADIVEADLEKMHSSWCRDWRLLLRNGLLIAATAVALFLIEAQLAGIVIGALIVVAALIGWLLKVTPPQVDSATGIFREAVRVLPLLKSFANENHERGRLRHAVSKAAAAEKRRTEWRSAVLAVGGFLVTAVVVYYLWYRAQQIEEGDGSFEAGRTLAFFLLTTILSVSTARMVMTFRLLSGSGQAAQRLALILAEDSEQLENGPFLPDSRGRLEGRIEFDQVSCSAEGVNRGSGSVAEFDLKIKPGQKVALVGAEDNGAALLFELLLGFHEIDGGEIKIDDRLLSEYPLAWLRGQIGWLPREPQFFSATVSENIGYGRPDASEKEIRDAAEKAGAVKFIDKLADGFDARMAGGGDSRDGFSPNRIQSHRLALARIFLEDPPLLAIEGLDPSEVISAQDQSGKTKSGGDDFAQIAAAEDLLMKDRTTIVVARRMSVTRDADQIVVMRNGRVEEQGNHSDLYEAKGYYRVLCEGPFGGH